MANFKYSYITIDRHLMVNQYKRKFIAVDLLVLEWINES